MRPESLSIALRSILCVAAAFVVVGPRAAAGDDGIEFFESRIRPVLAKNCYGCHSHKADKVRADLYLDSRSGWLAGGEHGPAIVIGDPQKSLLFRAISHTGNITMPPKDKLSDAVIVDFKTWIAMGAPAPQGKRNDPASGADHWSFLPLVRPAIPTVSAGDWPESDIDRFVLARLEEEKLRPAADADPGTLLRRVTYDLIGLPPTAAAQERFASEPTLGAFEEEVERLLASPEFGERWGRHWLDVARYSDSNGADINITHDNAWRYRDYVIQSFERDKPYDRFLEEQLAGDLLPYDNDRQRTDQLVATGFLMMGPKPIAANDEKIPAFFLDVVDEQLDTIGKAILGLAVGCARCHEHKFDPIPTEDYYSLAGIFSSTRTMTVQPKGDSRIFAMPLIWKRVELPLVPEDPARMEAEYQRQLKVLKDERVTFTKEYEAIKAKLDTLREKGGTPESIALLEKEFGEKNRYYKWSRQRLLIAEKWLQPKPIGMAVTDLDKPFDEHVRVQGVEEKKGALVARGFLTALTRGDAPAIPVEASGRRQLATWITDTRSGAGVLAARVMANRVWKHLFGTGIVATTDNFGGNGERPSHPRLLDHLASEFVDGGWSVKQLIRTIVLSRTYRLAFRADPRAETIDPANRLLWRAPVRRLDAESIWDTILLTSDRLDRRRGGPNLPVTGQLVVYSWMFEKLKEPSYRRRAVYMPIFRNANGASDAGDAVGSMLQTFDIANPTNVTGARDAATSPAQALTLLNSGFVLDASKEAAERLLAESAKDDAERIERFFRRALGRPADDAEKRLAAVHLSALEAELDGTPGATPDTAAERRFVAWTSFCQAVLSSNKFLFLR